MNSIADMGGMDGFGSVGADDPASHETFHADWEKRVLGVQFAILSAGLCNPDRIRFVTESMPPATYLTSTYFKRWLIAVEDILLGNGMITREEIASGHSDRAPVGCAIDSATARTIAEKGGSARMDSARTPRFSVGDRVTTRNINPQHHTRLPRYVRGKTGTVVALHGDFVFPDSNASEHGPAPQPVYGVRFTAVELWGEDANAIDTLQIDMFEDYLVIPETAS